MEVLPEAYLVAQQSEQARTLMRPFVMGGQSIGLGKSADFSLSHGAVQSAAEQALADIGTFEAEKAAKR